jgi:hypothetical protein
MGSEEHVEDLVDLPERHNHSGQGFGGRTGFPQRCGAVVAMTSLAFMLVMAPEPFWNTSIGKCTGCFRPFQPIPNNRWQFADFPVGIFHSTKKTAQGFLVDLMRSFRPICVSPP